jgi:hypothetical protein
MNKIEIYNDGNIKVEISEVFDYLVKRIIPKKIFLSQERWKELIEMTIDKLGNWYIYGNRVVTSSYALVFEEFKEVELTTEFSIFQDIVDVLILSKNKEDFRVSVNNLKKIYKEDGVVIDFFDKDKYGVSGFMAAKEENEITILLFSFNEEDFFRD